MPKVWVIQETKIDTSLSLRFGTPEVIFGRGIFPDEVRERVAIMANIMNTKIPQMSPMEDYILPIGDYFGVSFVFYCLGRAGLSPIRVLKWDGEHNSYYPIMINI